MANPPINSVTIKDVRITNGEMDAITLSNGKRLAGVVRGALKVVNGKTFMRLEIECDPTFNGLTPAQMAQELRTAVRTMDGVPVITPPDGAQMPHHERAQPAQPDDAALVEGKPQPVLRAFEATVDQLADALATRVGLVRPPHPPVPEEPDTHSPGMKDHHYLCGTKHETALPVQSYDAAEVTCHNCLTALRAESETSGRALTRR